MTYSKKTLALIGKQVVEKHPDIASGILQNITAPTCSDLTKIPGYFNIYCLSIGVKPEDVTGPVYKSSITEIKKVFLSAMLSMYGDQYLFKKVISNTLIQKQCLTTRMFNEVEFRSKKDEEFIQKVTSALGKIKQLN